MVTITYMSKHISTGFNELFCSAFSNKLSAFIINQYSLPLQANIYVVIHICHCGSEQLARRMPGGNLNIF